METVLKYLAQLRDNNNIAWFDLHRSEWAEVKSVFHSFVRDLIEGISCFDSSVSGLTVRDCTYKIQRDLRFSSDKTPYNSYLEIFIAPRGKKFDYAGYYFRIEPERSDFIARSTLSAGVYSADAVILRSIREEIFENGAQFTQKIKDSNGFVFNRDSKLKLTPKGFPKESKFDELLRQKNFYLSKPVKDSFLLSDSLLEDTLREFRRTTPFLELLNRAIHFGYEEMK